jgi:dihydropteroate synthase
VNPWPFATVPGVAASPAAKGWCWELGGGRRLELGGRAVIMGIVNVTPDSFFDGGQFLDADGALKQALRLVHEGADIIDVGGQSTRPGSAEVSLDEEISRVVPVIRELRARSDVAVSVDTYSAQVAEAALDAGADIVNDISAFRFDAEMLALIAARGVPAVAMHIQGTPRDMQVAPHYENVVEEVCAYLAEALERAEQAGVPRERVAIDPGIGFGKTVDHNLQLLRSLDRLRELGAPLLVGASRKSFIGKILDVEAEDRLEGTLAVSTLAVASGADILRVHDARPNLRAMRMAEAVVGRS